MNRLRFCLLLTVVILASFIVLPVTAGNSSLPNNWIELADSFEKAKKYAAQKRELQKRQKAEESRKRTHRLCVIGGAVESVLGCPIEEEDIPKLIGFLKRQEANGRYFSKAMQKEQIPETEEV